MKIRAFPIQIVASMVDRLGADIVCRLEWNDHRYSMSGKAYDPVERAQVALFAPDMARLAAFASLTGAPPSGTPLVPRCTGSLRGFTADELGALAADHFATMPSITNEPEASTSEPVSCDEPVAPPAPETVTKPTATELKAPPAPTDTPEIIAQPEAGRPEGAPTSAVEPDVPEESTVNLEEMAAPVAGAGRRPKLKKRIVSRKE